MNRSLLAGHKGGVKRLSELVSPEVVEQFFAVRRAAGYVPDRTVKAWVPLLVYLRGLGVVALAPELVLTAGQLLPERYRSHLICELRFPHLADRLQRHLGVGL